jgi:hypothetical protein
MKAGCAVLFAMSSEGFRHGGAKIAKPTAVRVPSCAHSERIAAKFSERPSPSVRGEIKWARLVRRPRGDPTETFGGMDSSARPAGKLLIRLRWSRPPGGRIARAAFDGQSSSERGSLVPPTRWITLWLGRAVHAARSSLGFSIVATSNRGSASRILWRASSWPLFTLVSFCQSSRKVRCWIHIGTELSRRRPEGAIVGR